MHPSTVLLALVGTAASANLANQLANQFTALLMSPPFPVAAVVQRIVTFQVPAADRNLGRRSDESCTDAAKEVLSKMSRGLSPIVKPTLVSKLSSYLDDHPEITKTAAGSDRCDPTAGPSVSGTLGSEVTRAKESLASFWSSLTPDLQSMWSQCSTIDSVSSAFVSSIGVCPSILADITGRPTGKPGQPTGAAQTQKAAAPRETGVAMAALGVAAMAVAALN
ncbi:hypothetical protein G6O67_000985 [Ophiocordyceps sinensis]|uniref:Infection structure specific protein n=1 Tax=Ophiocordyceps sinensis TaxID=72228 RepID=A0A8H4V8H5_9HYPO|nr:hypothetical protein G6O67_000985 [Ophiocordyceps sinensis]